MDTGSVVAAEISALPYYTGSDEFALYRKLVELGITARAFSIKACELLTLNEASASQVYNSQIKRDDGVNDER